MRDSSLLDQWDSNYEIEWPTTNTASTPSANATAYRPFTERVTSLTDADKPSIDKTADEPQSSSAPVVFDSNSMPITRSPNAEVYHRVGGQRSVFLNSSVL